MKYCDYCEEPFKSNTSIYRGMHKFCYLKYEVEYVDKINTINNQGKINQPPKPRYHDLIQEYANSPLNSWDYTTLLMLSRDEYDISIKLGTMHTTKSLLKLHCHGLIHKLDRLPTFDEQERLQAFLDSIIFQNYANNLKKVMTDEAKTFFKIVEEIMNINDMTDLLDLTEKGKKVLSEQRIKTLNIYNEMKKQLPEKFYEQSSKYESYLPMMVAMGLSGYTVGLLLSMSTNAQYNLLNNMMYNESMSGFESGDIGGFEFPDLSF